MDWHSAGRCGCENGSVVVDMAVDVGGAVGVGVDVGGAVGGDVAVDVGGDVAVGSFHD